MKQDFKFTYLLVFILLLTVFGCNNDDDINYNITTDDFVDSIDENPINGDVIGTVQAEGNGTLSFSITSQTPTGAIAINANTGELTVADASLFDFEINPEITANVSVSNSENTETIVATISLNNVNELSTQDFDVTIDENPTDGQILGTVQAAGDGTLSYSITSQTPAGALNIDTSTGELTVADPNLFDFETNPIITADILVDNSGNTETITATINLNDLDEVSAQNLSATIDENPTNGQVVGTIQASGGNLTYTITFQNPAGAFNINASTGELTVADAALFDFETNPNMLATVSVENSVNMVSVNANIDLNDLHEVGEFKFGGVIFWVNATNDEGYVVAMNNQSASAPYGCIYTSTGATGVAIGTGMANTNAILAVCSDSGTAADLAANLDSNGYDDWFLPSQNEMQEIMNNQTIINATLTNNGGEAFSVANANYWTSTEIDAAEARHYNYTNSWFPANLKANNGPVRAVRAWTDF